MSPERHLNHLFQRLIYFLIKKHLHFLDLYAIYSYYVRHSTLLSFKQHNSRLKILPYIFLSIKAVICNYINRHPLNIPLSYSKFIDYHQKKPPYKKQYIQTLYQLEILFRSKNFVFLFLLIQIFLSFSSHNFNHLKFFSLYILWKKSLNLIFI